MSEHKLLQRRLEVRSELDAALETGELTLERMRSIPPTTTSIEHHTTLMNTLKARERQETHKRAADTLGFLATKDALEESLLEKANAILNN